MSETSGATPVGADDGHEVHAAEAAEALRRARSLLSGRGTLDEATRADVLAALSDLEHALAPAIAARPAEARSVSQFAEAAATEATHAEPSGSLLSTALEGLTGAAERLEPRYPRVVGIAERIAQALAQIGI